VKALALLLAFALAAQGAVPIRFRTERAGFVSLNVYRPDGTLARQLLSGAAFAAGDHETAWDAAALPPGEYTWRAVFHEGLALKLRGFVGDFGGDRGAPSAATADDAQVYLGWSLATAQADAVVACDPAGNVRWTHRRGPLSGCRALAVDAGTLYVLGGEGDDAEGGALYKLSAKDGSAIPWPDGRTDLRITSLWPADGKNKPELADHMAAKNGRIYLSFTAGEFMAILDAKTGAYLQTVVGAPPGAVDAVATQSDIPEKPGKLEPADFVVTALKGAVIGKLLLMHDPIWVVLSDLTPLDRDERITALAMIGDGAKHHMHDIFTALGLPFHQIHARSAFATEGFSYVAGKPGGRPALGPWQPEKMKAIRALALDATGQLWVAEGDSIPRRISVWTTDTAEGRLVREYFAPPDPVAAVNPAEPQVLYAGGCEWRIDAGGRAACLGTITRDPMRAARYALEKDRVLLILTPAASGPDLVFERKGDGDFKPLSTPAPAAPSTQLTLTRTADGSWQFVTADGFALGTAFPAAEQPATATLTVSPDGKISVAAVRTRAGNYGLSGVETLRPLTAGKVTLPPR
jgi:hypothetical protein